MKIAQLAPPWISVPPKGYGGTEMIVHYLTEELVKRGHNVTLFASGDSKTKAQLSSIFREAIGNSGELKNQPLNPLLHYIECFERAKEFDIIHNHAQYYAMFLSDLVKTPVVHTIHGSFSKEDVPSKDKRDTLSKFKNHNFVSISDSQRKGLESLNYVATVYNGIDLLEFSFSAKKGDYLCWMGRVTQKKGPVEAVETAKILGLKLKMAGTVDPIDKEYCETVLYPLISQQKDSVEFTEEIGRRGKSDLYKGALCTLYPIHWSEPFGLVMIESMACGTPVVAFNRGSVPEIIKDGVTGFIVDSEEDTRSKSGNWIIKKKGIEGLIEAVKMVDKIDRNACRKHVEENFTVSRMVDGYERVYNQLISKSTNQQINQHNT